MRNVALCEVNGISGRAILLVKWKYDLSCAPVKNNCSCKGKYIAII